MESKISRRSALKRIGATVIGGAVAASGLLPLASCSNGESKRIIFYFTGTGNCLYIARQLAEENTILLSIPQLVKQGRYDFEADEIGIVYPIYGHMPPNMVREFIKKARLKAGYKFAVLTYGARKCDAVEIWDRISRNAGNAFDYIGTIIMVDNWLPNFDMNEQIKIDIILLLLFSVSCSLLHFRLQYAFLIKMQPTDLVVAGCGVCMIYRAQMLPPGMGVPSY